MVVVMMVMAAPVAVLHALPAGSPTLKLSAQVVFHRRTDGALGAGRDLNPELGEKLQRSTSHASAEHDIGPLFFDKPRHLTGPMSRIKGIFHHPAVLNGLIFHIDQGKKWTAAKMVCYGAFQPLIPLS
jgi:hypothetical protein